MCRSGPPNVTHHLPPPPRLCARAEIAESGHPLGGAGCPGLLDGPSLGQIGAQNEGERGALRHVAGAHDVHQSEPGGRSHAATVYAIISLPGWHEHRLVDFTRRAERPGRTGPPP
jgi:hypothetical protein